MTFRLYHGNGPRPKLRYYDEFLSEGGGDITAWIPEKAESDELKQSVSFRTPQECLLWPGSGIYFWWEWPTP